MSDDAALEAKLAEVRAKHAAELAEAERLTRMQAAITSALHLGADAWTPGFMHVHVADCFIVLRAETLSDALLLAERANPEPLAKVKRAGTTSFQPLEIFEARGSKGDHELVCPYVYDVERTVVHHAETRTLRYYVKAAGFLVEVRVQVAQDPDTRIDYVVLHRTRDGQVRQARREIINRSGHFPRVVKWWSSLESPGRFTLYA